ncbi:phospholipid scramblase 1-like [Sitodiplosis mosellana]|uniref:phospholipid scramblase 1-like n=1 Tax=Sitodiplosis mosellana TaxID=263140 RepID=UPI002443C506|nr:phospholipid scramblase 1-like [Sitodiplosis mosellana]XP_055304799.1 phospholipid scramblase 1-like [Sitodiplosis mosellana]
MNMPTNVNPICSPGLEYLALIDQLLVHQKIELFEAFTGFQTNNKYVIRNTLGQNVYWAIEKSDFCNRLCCGPSRSFNMQITDAYQQEVIHLYRPLACSSCCFPCCLQSIEISAPVGNIIGIINQEWTLCYPNFTVKNDVGETVLRIEGPFLSFSCGRDVEFKILSLEGTQVGKISKQWSGLAREFFTEADNFGISFPMDLDVRMKAVMLGACILIDMIFYENSGQYGNAIASFVT